MATRVSNESRTGVAERVDRGHTIPGAWYTDPAIFELEKELIFRRTWQYVGLAGEIPRPGDFVGRHAGHIPVVVVRGEDGEIRAFVNMCRHRGSPLVNMSRPYGRASDGRPLALTEDATEFQFRGHRMNLQCSYHAWTYRLDGALHAAPRSNMEAAFDKSEWSLVPVRVEMWGPMIFVNPDLEAEPLAGTLGELPELFAQAGVDVDEVLKARECREYVYASNWKVTVDNFNECYHCPVAHPGLSAAMDVKDTYLWFDEHDHYSWYGMRDKRSQQLSHLSFIWPNIGVGVLADGKSAQLTWMIPLGLDRSVLFRQYCFADSVDDDEARSVMNLFDQVSGEDKTLCENVQRGLQAGMFDEGCIMSKSEMGIHQFHKLLSRAIPR